MIRGSENQQRAIVTKLMFTRFNKDKEGKCTPTSSFLLAVTPKCLPLLYLSALLSVPFLGYFFLTSHSGFHLSVFGSNVTP